MRVYFYTHDPLLTMIYTDREAVDLFGGDHLAEFGKEIPDKLVTRFLDARAEFFAVCAELERVKEAV